MTARSTHTPGPWVATRGVAGLCVEDSRREYVACEIDNPADQSLIAAAPDMLAALEKITNDIQWASARLLRGGAGSKSDARSQILAALVTAQNAIARARGQ